MDQCYQCGTGKPEEWTDVINFPGYLISDHGHVRNADTGRVLALGPETKKYARTSLRRDGGTFLLTVHPLVLRAFAGPPVTPDLHVLHNDDDGRHNHLGNLRYGTHADNAADRTRNGRHWNQAKTHCPWGHELIPANLTAASLRRGTRACLACSRASSIARNARKRGETVDRRALADAYYADILTGVAHPHARDRTHCPLDHTLAAPNIIAAFVRAGRRGCLACHRARGYVAHHPDANLHEVADQYYAKIKSVAA